MCRHLVSSLPSIGICPVRPFSPPSPPRLLRPPERPSNLSVEGCSCSESWRGANSRFLLPASSVPTATGLWPCSLHSRAHAGLLGCHADCSLGNETLQYWDRVARLYCMQGCFRELAPLKGTSSLSLFQARRVCFARARALALSLWRRPPSRTPARLFRLVVLCRSAAAAVPPPQRREEGRERERLGLPSSLSFPSASFVRLRMRERFLHNLKSQFLNLETVAQAPTALAWWTTHSSFISTHDIR